MTDEAAVRTLAHRQNIARYNSLLKTELTEIERAFIDRRIAEEEAEVRRLSATSRRRRAGEAGEGRMPFDQTARGDDRFSQNEAS